MNRCPHCRGDKAFLPACASLHTPPPSPSAEVKVNWDKWPAAAAELEADLAVPDGLVDGFPDATAMARTTREISDSIWPTTKYDKPAAASDERCQHVNQTSDGNTLSCDDCGSSIHIGDGWTEPEPAVAEAPREWRIWRTAYGIVRGPDLPEPWAYVDVIEKSAYDEQVKRAAETYAHYESELIKLKAENLRLTQNIQSIENGKGIQNVLESLKAMNEVKREQDACIDQLTRELAEAKESARDWERTARSDAKKAVRWQRERDQAISAMERANSTNVEARAFLQAEQERIADYAAEVARLREALEGIRAHSIWARDKNSDKELLAIVADMATEALKREEM